MNAADLRREREAVARRKRVNDALRAAVVNPEVLERAIPACRRERSLAWQYTPAGSIITCASGCRIAAEVIEDIPLRRHRMVREDASADA